MIAVWFLFDASCFVFFWVLIFKYSLVLPAGGGGTEGKVCVVCTVFGYEVKSTIFGLDCPVVVEVIGKVLVAMWYRVQGNSIFQTRFPRPRVF